VFFLLLNLAKSINLQANAIDLTERETSNISPAMYVRAMQNQLYFNIKLEFGLGVVAIIE